jgi:hypothetical protein
MKRIQAPISGKISILRVLKLTAISRDFQRVLVIIFKILQIQTPVAVLSRTVILWQGFFKFSITPQDQENA